MRSVAKSSALGLLCGLLVAGFGGSGPDSAPAAEPPVATDARLGGDEARMRFVLDLTRRVEVSAFTLADPYRVVLDLPQIVFRLPAKVGADPCWACAQHRTSLAMMEPASPRLPDSSLARSDRMLP